MMKRNSKLLRTLSVLAVIALVCLGLALPHRYGHAVGLGPI